MRAIVGVRVQASLRTLRLAVATLAVATLPIRIGSFHSRAPCFTVLPPGVCRLKAPTVSRLHGDEGYAIQIAAETGAVPTLIPIIKENGGSGIVVTTIRMLVG